MIHDRRIADEQTAADHGEPSREQIEWEMHLAEAIRLAEEDIAANEAWDALPIGAATAAWIARNEAVELDDEWARIGRGGWSA